MQMREITFSLSGHPQARAVVDLGAQSVVGCKLMLGTALLFIESTQLAIGKETVFYGLENASPIVRLGLDRVNV